MDSVNVENIFLKILKRLLLITIGSGLIGNALYVYGLGYYQGYIEGLGFEYNLFPVEWGETIIWTYFASRELGASSLELLNKSTASAIFIILGAFYFLARVWMETSGSKPRADIYKKTKVSFRLAKKFSTFAKNILLLSGLSIFL